MTTEPDSSAQSAEQRGAASATVPPTDDPVGAPASGPTSTGSDQPDHDPAAFTRPAPTTTGKAAVGKADVAFKNLTRAAGLGLLALIVAIALFLVLRATHALGENDGNFLSTQEWFPNQDPPKFGVAALLFGTIVTAAIAMIIAVPVAVGIALFITVYAPRRLSSPLGYIVDLLAAVPSVVYGLWGLLVLAPHMKGIQLWLSDYLGWIPLFSADSVGRSFFVAGVVLAIMILPIVAALSREVFLQVPTAHREAALALGATRWEMIRTAVLPYGKPGVISASMLGLGRAMGETIAVALVLPASFKISWNWLEPAGNTIAANVANGWGEANDIGRGALIASGLVLFVVTMIVNIIARAIVARRRDFSGSSA
ncbi:phosphate ABC transporter permease subunit PstC [Frankia sp. AgPm24]|uniref:Phosphate transport system permease protein n=1 Tax=Frankia umida TaxID=573489 RepID=A0ABT0JS28_9ACTN|nr:MULTISPECIES: phosphate ABC transporter permease subunit PstC [Frankia]MCK9874294.1 phosphate ABC transporter permease subunit PstC [Frankia umida]MCK9921087.1 phosphate ABC transporter permease subunit PstC [Frankia sp. AgPm24]